MKVLVATNIPGVTEFCYVPEDEIVSEHGVVCCNSGYCGCSRSVSGTDTPKATTTVKVAEVDVDRDDLFDLAAKVGRSSGWGGDIVLAGIRKAVEHAEPFEVGTVLQVGFDFDAEDYVYEPVPQEQLDAARREDDEAGARALSALFGLGKS